jgi:hypothetical protein
VNNDHISALVGGLAGVALASLVAGISEAVGLVALLAALCAAGGREAAILARRSEPEVRRLTATGFFIGLGFGVVMLVVAAVGVIK